MATKKLSNYIRQGVRNVKSFVVNKANSFSPDFNIGSLVSNYSSRNREEEQANAAKIQSLMSKSPFEKASQFEGVARQRTDPLGFQHLQYPTELTGNELGNWILFLTITNNVGNNPAFGADFKLAQDMEEFPWSPFGDNSFSPSEDNQEDVHRKVHPKAYDTLRWEYRNRGIEIPKVKMQNVVATTAVEGGLSGKSVDLVSGAIALYMPTDVKVSYGQEWGPEDTNIAGDISQAWKSFSKSESEGLDLVHEMLMHGFGIGVKAAKEFTGHFGAGAGIGDWFKIAGKNLGFAINNHREMFYEGPEFRTFGYSFAFWPRNQAETIMVQKIITMFKYHMHPWKKTEYGSRFFQYPSEFEIHYLAGAGVNKHLNKISRCALTKVDVSYAPEGGNFKTFGDYAPVTYKVDLTFKELEYMTKQTMLEGY